MTNQRIKIVAIVGPTASGKTDLSLELAEKHNGEIICADSRTIYRGMDIGTAKPSAQEQARVPHHLLDVISPNERLNVAQFKQLAEEAIADIHARGKVPFLVGGSGLYIDAVVYDYKFPAAADEKLRIKLENLSNEALQQRLKKADPEMAQTVDLDNRRRVIRALETAGHGRTRLVQVPDNILMLGLRLNTEVMQSRIAERIKKMLEKGFLAEVKEIGATYGWDSEAMTGIGYRAFKGVVLGTKSIDSAAAEFAAGDRLLVKKQMTWFKRNEAIVWLDNPGEAEKLVGTFLAE
jgi:tRNA dimethylallyltransferase